MNAQLTKRDIRDIVDTSVVETLNKLENEYDIRGLGNIGRPTVERIIASIIEEHYTRIEAV